MSRNIAEVLLDRYLKGETPAAENELVERWLEENSAANHEWQTLDQQSRDKWLADVFSEIKGTITKKDIKPVKLPQRLLLRNIAAAAAIFIISFTVYLQLQKRSYPAQLIALNVAAHQKKQVSLPDGSQVWVNERSELRYPKTFNGKLREVYLSGEAYFDIQHDIAKPFIIHTGSVITTVLGTAFNIREDKNHHRIEVTVTRGKVSVANGNELLGIITPNQQISYDISKDKAVKETVDASMVIAWQKSDLHFEDVSFEEATDQLQRHFNVKISFSNNKLKNCRFTGTSLKEEKLDKILKVICAFNNATYRIKPDGSIMIDGPGCN